MLSLGGSLYQLTDRDRQTLRLDPYAETLQYSVLTAGNSSETKVFRSVPIDRALYLEYVLWGGGPGVLAFWTLASLVARQVKNPNITLTLYQVSGTTTAPLRGDNVQTAVTGQAFNVNKQLGLLLPPGVQPEFTLGRDNTTNNASFPAVQLFGWLIPAGNIGRSF